MVALSMAAADAVVGFPGEVGSWVVAERGTLPLGHSTQFDEEAGGSFFGVQSPGWQDMILNLLPLIQQC